MSPSNAGAPEDPPALHTCDLTRAQVQALHDDLNTCATDIRCQARQPEQPQPELITLDRAIELALRGAPVQIQYEYDGARWRDTLLQRGQMWRLVRYRASEPADSRDGAEHGGVPIANQ